jgi:small membrane protein
MSVLPSQIILGVAMVAFVLYAFWLRTILFDRIIYLLLAMAGLVLVIRPALSTDLAHLFGIGRGADLLLYALVILSLFRAVGVTSELRQINRRITLIARALALDAPVERARDQQSAR